MKRIHNETMFLSTPEQHNKVINVGNFNIDTVKSIQFNKHNTINVMFPKKLVFNKHIFITIYYKNGNGFKIIIIWRKFFFKCYYKNKKYNIEGLYPLCCIF